MTLDEMRTTQNHIDIHFGPVGMNSCLNCPWAGAGYCPVHGMGISGCVEVDGYCKGAIEEIDVREYLPKQDWDDAMNFIRNNLIATKETHFCRYCGKGNFNIDRSSYAPKKTSHNKLRYEQELPYKDLEFSRPARCPLRHEDSTNEKAKV